MLFYGHSETGESGMKKTQFMFKGRGGAGVGRVGANMHTRRVPFPSPLGRSLGAKQDFLGSL